MNEGAVMSFIEWNVNLYTGLPDVDQQHNKLVALVNRLTEVSGEDAEVLDQAFLQLQDYVIEHFTHEERLMDEAQIDPEHVKYHKNAHALFVAKIAELWETRASDEDQTLNDMLEFLKSWILQHILQTDRKMAGKVHEKLGTEAPHNMFTHF
jgi:hemerythrin-like metal-binding protein